MSTVVILFEAALLTETFQTGAKQKRLLSFFPLRLKTRMSCYTGATQSSIIKPNVDRDILPLEVAVSLNLLPLIFGNGFRSFQVVLELSDHGHQQLSPFYRVEY